MLDPTDRLGHFAVHGGPGRPKGSRNRVTRQAEALRSKLLELAEKNDYRLVTILAEKAEAGDMKAADLFLGLLRSILPRHIEVDAEEWDEGDFERTLEVLKKHGFRPPNQAFKFRSWGKNQN